MTVLEKALTKFIQSSDTRVQSGEATLRNHTASLYNLENQVGQIAKSLSERPQGSLLSNTETNPREHVKAITLRSGREVESRLALEKTSVEAPKDVEVEEVPKRKEVAPPPYKPRIPYPSRLKNDQNDEQYKKFLGLFKQLHINITCVESLSQMPKCVKFLKNLLTNKRKLEESASLILDATCSVVLQKSMPSKRKDPGSFIIPCNIGDLGKEKALADSGASINVMPYTFLRKPGLGEPKPTRMTL